MAVNNEIKFNKVYNLSISFLTKHTKQEQQQGIKKGYKATLNQVRYLCGSWADSVVSFLGRLLSMSVLTQKSRLEHL